MYRLGILILPLNEMICEVHLFELTFPIRLKLTKCVTKLLAIFRVLVQKFNLAHPVVIELLIFFLLSFFTKSSVGVPV